MVNIVHIVMKVMYDVKYFIFPPCNQVFNISIEHISTNSCIELPSWLKTLTIKVEEVLIS